MNHIQAFCNMYKCNSIIDLRVLRSDNSRILLHFYFKEIFKNKKFHLFLFLRDFLTLFCYYKKIRVSRALNENDHNNFDKMMINMVYTL